MLSVRTVDRVAPRARLAQTLGADDSDQRVRAHELMTAPGTRAEVAQARTEDVAERPQDETVLERDAELARRLASDIAMAQRAEDLRMRIHQRLRRLVKEASGHSVASIELVDVLDSGASPISTGKTSAAVRPTRPPR